MDDISISYRSDIIIEKRVRTNFNGPKHTPERALTNPVIDNLIAEGGENFFIYLNCLGLTVGSHLLILSSRQHYYYDCNDFHGVTTLINLRKLNLIKHLDSFLHTVYNILSPDTNFIGCFSDLKSQNRNRLSSGGPKKVNNFLESGKDLKLDRKEASRLLESHGFKVIDMTEINELTYFSARNI